jgi:hypothetical protein
MILSQKPTSLVLVGALFISIFLGLGLAEQYSTGSEEINKLKEISSDLIPSQKSTDLGQLKVDNGMIYYPWASRQTMGMRNALPSTVSKSPAKNEEVLMDNSHPLAMVQDISAINSVKKRDLIFRDSQTRGPLDQRLVNSLDIDVLGAETGDKLSNLAADVDDLESVLNPSQRVESPEKFAGDRSNNAGNYLNVDVSGISVRAINTVEGGSAVATSNIVIEPVQIIICDQAVRDKLI